MVKPGPSPCPLIRIDTNQGVYGLGEVRDIAGDQYAMVLKSRIVGENPLNIDFLFEKIAQFGGVSRQAGGVSAVEMALWDIAGKVYNCPVYQMLGGKWRDNDPHLCRYYGVEGPTGVWTASERTHSDGPDMDEDGSRHRYVRRNSEYRDAALGPEQLGAA